MKIKSPAIRLTLSVVLIMVNLLFAARLLGFVPDQNKAELESRKTLSESLALQFSIQADQEQYRSMQETLRHVVDRNPEIRSGAVRTEEGELLAVAGNHLGNWRPVAHGKSTPTHITVPLFRKGEKWAVVQLRYAPLWLEDSPMGFLHSFTGFLGFMALAGFLSYGLLLKWSLRELDPSAVIPERVQNAFDVLQEGVIILDEREHIVMANQAFSKWVQTPSDKLVGRKGSELNWWSDPTEPSPDQLPWLRVLDREQGAADASLVLADRRGRRRKLVSRAVVIPDGKGKCRGALVTFDDITLLEEKNFELNLTIDKLQAATQEISLKNKELETLANHDPLTLCLNRRAFNSAFKHLHNHAESQGGDLSCLMVDIDFFKSVNDNHGHAMGDRVIKMVADVLKTATRDTDLVGRYGGEEFCVVLPGMDLEKALSVAERIRSIIQGKACDQVKVTASLGVAAISMETTTPDQMVDQADKALYAAKENGRNRVVAWGDPLLNQTGDPAQAPQKEAAPESDVPEQAPSREDALKARVAELEAKLQQMERNATKSRRVDTVTGLPKLSVFKERTTREIVRCSREDKMLAILSISLETVRQVSETMGTEAGDQLVAHCARRLLDLLRRDVDTVAVMDNAQHLPQVSRMGPTELGILLVHIDSADQVTWIMRRIQEAFKAPFVVMDNELYVNACFGISLYPHDGETTDHLFTAASNACRFAQKQLGSNRYMYSSKQLNEHALGQLQIENALHQALTGDEFTLYYQPKLHAGDHSIVGFEALLRWESKQIGPIPPDRFIPVAEKSGQIDEIGLWVIEAACKQLRTWLDMGVHPGSIAVNLSGIQLRQPALPAQIGALLEEYRLGVEMLEIELTETSLLNTRDEAFSVLKQIQKMGLKVTMDDFGTGYSSLSYLGDMPISSLKIDKSFISGLGRNAKADMLVQTIISIAHGLGLTVVAEGVEKEQQAEDLARLGCEYLQGYYFDPPLPPEKILKRMPEKQPAKLN